MTEPTFNLIDEPWIGAIDGNGKLREFSLRDLLAQAHELKELYDDSPLVLASLLRVILALLHRVYDGPHNRREWQSIWQKGSFDLGKVDAYFDTWYNRFDLFDHEHPFFQTPGSFDDAQTASLTVLLHELSSGSNATLFDHTTDGVSITLNAASAARMLLTVHAYGFSGRVSGPAYFSDGPCVRDILFFAEGDNVFETLVLNMIEYTNTSPLPIDEADMPAWEMEDPYTPQRQIPFGYLDFLTWQNRRIRLVPEIFKDGIRVGQMTLNPGLQMHESVVDLDPMKHYRIDEKDGFKALRFREGRELWRDSVTLMQIGASDRQVPAILRWLNRLCDRGMLTERNSVRVMALGMATEPGKAVVHFMRNEHLPLPLEYLENTELVDLLKTSLATAEEAATELWKASGTLASVMLVPDENSERRANPDDVRDLRMSMGTERRYWSMLEPNYRELVYALPQNSADAMTQWFEWLRSSAWEVFDEVCNGLGDDPRALKAAVRGREQLARGLGTVLKIK